VAAGRRSLDDEPVHASVRLSRERDRERVRRDDREEERPLDGGRSSLGPLGRIEAQERVVTFLRAGNRERVFGGLAAREAVEDTRHPDRNPRSHEDRGDSREHRAPNGREDRKRDLLEVVDPDGSRVTFAREEHLGEVRHDAELDELLRGARPRVHRNPPVRRPLGTSVRREPPVQDTRRHRGERKGRERTAHRAVRVAVLQPAREEDVQGRPRDDSQLADAGHRVREDPVRDPDTHPALDDLRQLHHGVSRARLVRRV
jgi:hypothetical protein